jgi:hypothetical protein
MSTPTSTTSSVRLPRAKTDARVRYLTFTHPGFGRDFKTTVALYPTDDCRSWHVMALLFHRRLLGQHSASSRNTLVAGRLPKAEVC